MKFTPEIEAFIKNYVKDLEDNNAALFVGAGMSKAAGYVDWIELLKEIADELKLKSENESGNLISLAQFHFNETGGRAGLTRKILEEFSRHTEFTENHKIIARLPIRTIWTTNYDSLLEDAMRAANKVVETKHQVKQLANSKPRRDVVIFKMHGDSQHPADAILTKQQYESYYKTHEPFITALSGDLVSKTFLFIGFSFSDPNLDYVLSRLNIQFGADRRQHYCFIKKETRKKDEDGELYSYRIRKQELMIGDLKRYGIKTLLIEDYPVITNVLKEIENRFQKKTIFISGSAEEYGSWERSQALSFIHQLSKGLVESGYTIVTGFGWGVGSAVINGALDGIYAHPDRYSEEQIIMRPFPQFKSGSKELPEMREAYRRRMISLAGIVVILFGNKLNSEKKLIMAPGVRREFEIATELGLVPIPIASTGYVAEEIYHEIMNDPARYYGEEKWIVSIIKKLSSASLDSDEIIKQIISIVQLLNK